MSTFGRRMQERNILRSSRLPMNDPSTYYVASDFEPSEESKSQDSDDAVAVHQSTTPAPTTTATTTITLQNNGTNIQFTSGKRNSMQMT